VTLLFTDIEGSTVLLQRLGAQRYREALELHRRVLREAFDRHGGYEVDCEGDAFFVAFARATEAIAAASEAQPALAQAEWPGGMPIRVRIGIHTGTPLAAPPKYVGLDVHKAARIMAAGHGGQVLVSDTARGAAGEAAACIDLGEHRLKDVEEPVWLFQLGDGSFPPLKSISNTNLPRLSSSFVGRQSDLREVWGLLEAGGRLVTLTGPGGAGKTRLAIEAATQLVDAFPNGVFWVPLAAVRDSALVLPTISQLLGSANGLAAHIGDRKLLLVLDNLEQVVDAAAALPALIETCPNLHLLVTSRELLRVRGEQEYAVRALPAADAVELFCARSGVAADESVIELCERLDRLPLAIELAAARAGVLSPGQILERLGSRLDLLKGGRDAEARHETLRATIAWSHDLLSAGEQLLFARLAVFRGGCTLDAAETVVDADVDTLQSLLDKNLVRRDSARFDMLETVREFASEQLAGSHEAAALRRRHGWFFLELAENVEAQLQSGERARLLDQLEVERDNLRVALEWAAECAEPELELRLTAALREFWEARGPLGEGLRQLDHAVRRAGDRLPERRLDVLRWGALSALQVGEWETAERLATEAVALARQLGDTEATVSALIKLTHAAAGRGAGGRAHALIEQALALAQDTGEPELIARALINYGSLVHGEGDPARAAALAEQGLEAGGESLKPRVRAIALNNLAEARIALGQTAAEVTAPLLEVIELAPSHGDNGLLGSVLEMLASVGAQSDPVRAATLLGAAHALLKQMGEEPNEEKATDVLAERNDEAERAYRLGLSFDLETAIDYALQPSRGRLRAST
jgi:predicted ATPase